MIQKSLYYIFCDAGEDISKSDSPFRMKFSGNIHHIHSHKVSEGISN